MGTAKLPEELIEEMINAGAKVITCGKRKKDMLRNVIFQANSDAHQAYIKFCSKFDDDQSTIFDPVVTSVAGRWHYSNACRYGTGSVIYLMIGRYF
jgi:hypothetical protein